MKPQAAIPRFTLRAEEAPAAFGVKPAYFREYIAPELRCIRRGRLKLYPVAEIERWCKENAVLTLPEDV